MTRFAARVDTTHAEIREGLRQLGCTVHDTARMGRDFADLVVGFHSETYLLEVKWNRPTKEGGKHKESSGQVSARTLWRGGPWLVVTSLLDAVRQMGMEHELVEQLQDTHP